MQRRIPGIAPRVALAAISPYFTLYDWMNPAILTLSVMDTGVEVKLNPIKNSFHANMKLNNAPVMRIGTVTGNTNFQKMVNRDAPSIKPDSSNSTGTWLRFDPMRKNTKGALNNV